MENLFNLHLRKEASMVLWSNTVYIQFHIIFIGGDQGLLNLYFSDWAHKDISKHLPFVYNVCSTACYSYLPAFKQLSISI